MSWTIHESPIGPLTLVGGPAGLTGLHFPGEAVVGESRSDDFSDAVRQLDEYFEGARRTFALALDLRGGTAFQRAVWNELLKIPYGESVSYSELASLIGR